MRKENRRRRHAGSTAATTQPAPAAAPALHAALELLRNLIVVQHTAYVRGVCVTLPLQPYRQYLTIYSLVILKKMVRAAVIFFSSVVRESKRLLTVRMAPAA